MALVWLLAACGGGADVRPEAETALAYEVVTSSGKWVGEYFDQSGARVPTNPMEQPSGWRYEFKTSQRPFQMFLNANSSQITSGTAASPDVTINFYVDGQLVRTETNNWAKGVTTIVYDVP
jgi:hypothetical protein